MSVQYEVIQAFSAKFRKALQDSREAGENTDLQHSSISEAIEFANANSLAGGEQIVASIVSLRRSEYDSGRSSLDIIRSSLEPMLLGLWNYMRGVLCESPDEIIKHLLLAIADDSFELKENALVVLGVAFLDKQDFEQAIKCFEKGIAGLDDESPDLPIVLCLLGDAFAASKNFERAIANYELALKRPNCESIATVLNNLGNAYAAREDFGRAIECYERAVSDPGIEPPHDLFSNIGTVHAIQKNYDKAIHWYEKAISIPGHQPLASTLNNLGSAYFAKNDITRALEFYEKAVNAEASDDSKASYYCNFARTLRFAGEISNAKAKLKLAKTLANAASTKLRIELELKYCEAKEAEISLSSQEESLSKQAFLVKSDAASRSPEARISIKLNGLEDQYSKYLKRATSGRDNILSTLRGWSSAVTLLEGAEDSHWRGGGYFLKWKSKGIVIDPGFDFLDNFHDHGYHMSEVDTILVSHNHPDHNSDLSSLDNLRYEMNWRATRETEGKRVPALPQMCVAIDADTALAFGDAPASHRGSPYVFSRFDQERKRWLLQHSNFEGFVEHFYVKHSPDVPHALGLKITLNDSDIGGNAITIGYTGDTEYFPDLSSYLNSCDVLIAHISQPDPREFEATQFIDGSLTKDAFRKDYHLGYNGVTRLIQETRPKIVLVGEFWAGLADLRIEIIQGLRRRLDMEAIFPTGLGFHLQLPTFRIECSSCKNFVCHSSIRVVPPTAPFGSLGYLCNDCVI